MLAAMWSRLRQVFTSTRRSVAPRVLTAAHDLRQSLRLLSWRPSRPALPRRIRVVRPGSRPMRVVYEQAVVHDRPSFRSRVVARGARLFVKPLFLLLPLNDTTLKALRSIDRWSARGPRSKYVEPVQFELGGVRVESMTHRYGPSSDMTILYLHGGAFFSCGIETHRRVCERLALYSGAQVVSVDYVQLPEGTVADSVQDAITAYEALLETVAHPDKVVVAGDSAGGYLTMKIAELATRRGLTPPAALLTFSPMLSLDFDRDDKGIARVTRVRDAYLPMKRVGVARARWVPEGAAIEGYASPLFASGYISSPAFFVAAEDEMLRPEVEAMALQLSARGVDVETHLWRSQVHAFPVLADAMPESREALKLAADFARRAVGEPEQHHVKDADQHVETVVGELLPDDVSEDDEVIDVELETGSDDRKRWFFQAS